MAQNRTPRQPSRGHRATAHHHAPGKTQHASSFGRAGAPRARKSAHGPTKGPKVHSSGPKTAGGGFIPEDPHLNFDADGLHIPTGNTEILLTRRQLLYGAAGVGALVAVGAGVSAAKNASTDASTVSTLSVSSSNVFTVDNCTEVSADNAMSEVIEYQLPYGSLVWANSDTVAACLIPTETVKPLARVSLLGITTGSTVTVLENAVGQSEGFEIYDVRCCDKGIIWAEANILLGTWRLYAAALSGYDMGTYRMVDSGDETTEMPTIAAVSDHAFWQIMPASSTSTDPSYVKSSPFTNPTQVSTIYTATGRMSTAITPATDGVVIAPRHAGTKTYRDVTLLDESGNVKDSFTLPSRMAPIEATYGRTGLMFCFESIYSYGDGIANLGTYVPAKSHSSGDYANLSWFRFGRTPLQPPAWCGSWLMVKSTSAVIGIDLANRMYFSLSVDNNAKKYGDYLASTGSHAYAVTCMNIDSSDSTDTTTTTDSTKYCLVRVWEPQS